MTSTDQLLSKINSSLYRSSGFQNGSLYVGSAGKVLFQYHYSKYQGHPELVTKFEQSLNDLAVQTIELSNHTFCNGKAGAYWLFSYLCSKNIISAQDQAAVCYDIGDLATIATQFINQGNFDFLHGSMGLFYYFLYDQASTQLTPEYFDHYIKTLGKLQVDTPFGKSISNKFLFDRHNQSDEINLGLSHGLPSVLRVLVESYRKGIAPEVSKRLAFNLIDCMLACRNKVASPSTFPSVINLQSPEKSTVYSRLAWCYGDLGAAYVLYQAAKIFNDRSLSLVALEILEQTTIRKSNAETGVNDFGLCHGVAGISHIYHQLSRQTDLPIFNAANKYWLDKLLQPSFENDWSPYFTMYSGTNRAYYEDLTFLEGTLGIGLVILSHLTDEMDWDYCLMLNE